MPNAAPILRANCTVDVVLLPQLSVAIPQEKGVKILVAIADVDALVRKGLPIDLHAQQNTTSVYTPAVIFPMLPEKLSTNLTSLSDHAERVAVLADIDWMRKLKKNTNASGASITTHFSGLPKIGM